MQLSYTIKIKINYNKILGKTSTKNFISKVQKETKPSLLLGLHIG